MVLLFYLLIYYWCRFVYDTKVKTTLWLKLENYIKPDAQVTYIWLFQKLEAHPLKKTRESLSIWPTFFTGNSKTFLIVYGQEGGKNPTFCTSFDIKKKRWIFLFFFFFFFLQFLEFPFVSRQNSRLCVPKLLILKCFVFKRVRPSWKNHQCIIEQVIGACYTRALIQINADPKWTPKI